MGRVNHTSQSGNGGGESLKFRALASDRRIRRAVPAQGSGFACSAEGAGPPVPGKQDILASPS